MDKELGISWAALLVGLEKQFLDVGQVVDTINANDLVLKADDDLIVYVNTHRDDTHVILQLLEEKANANYEQGNAYWQLRALLKIKDSAMTIKEKLEHIASEWASFHYPAEWQHFIYYMPTKGTGSKEQVYQEFLTYIDKLAQG